MITIHDKGVYLARASRRRAPGPDVTPGRNHGLRHPAKHDLIPVRRHPPQPLRSLVSCPHITYVGSAKRRKPSP
jgi:hypothetical protein